MLIVSLNCTSSGTDRFPEHHWLFREPGIVQIKSGSPVLARFRWTYTVQLTLSVTQSVSVPSDQDAEAISVPPVE